MLFAWAYQPRQFDQALLHRRVAAHWPRVRATCAAHSRPLPPVPLRQWVLSLPKMLRYALAYEGKLCRAVAKTAMQELFRFQRLQARRARGLGSTKQAHTGAMVAVQRFGSALNLNIHFHALVLAGVFMVDAFGHPVFMELAPPSLGDLHRVTGRIAEAVLALLRRRHIWLDDLDENEDEDPVAQASLSGALVFGSTGAKPVRLKDARVWTPNRWSGRGRPSAPWIERTTGPFSCSLRLQTWSLCARCRGACISDQPIPLLTPLPLPAAPAPGQGMPA